MLTKSKALLLVVCGALLLPGCSTNGDPHTGGIFWSESAAQQRLRERRAHLDAVESSTDSVHRSNRRLEGAAARRQQVLDE